jgi:predicted RNase H-like HicB family nuclease
MGWRVFISGGLQMIFEYCQKAIEKAEYKKLDDGTWYAEVPGFRGVWANAETVEDCRKELITVLEEWIVLKLRDGDVVPEVDGLSVEITRVAVA